LVYLTSIRFFSDCCYRAKPTVNATILDDDYFRQLFVSEVMAQSCLNTRLYEERLKSSKLVEAFGNWTSVAFLPLVKWHDGYSSFFLDSIW